MAEGDGDLGLASFGVRSDMIKSNNAELIARLQSKKAMYTNDYGWSWRQSTVSDTDCQAAADALAKADERIAELERDIGGYRMGASTLHDATRRAEERAETLESKVDELNERLENNHMFDAQGCRINVEPGSIPDGIECRDETIKILSARAEAAERRASNAEAHEARIREQVATVSAAWSAAEAKIAELERLVEHESDEALKTLHAALDRAATAEAKVADCDTIIQALKDQISSEADAKAKVQAYRRAAEDRATALEARVKVLEEALTPSEFTKTAYQGRFEFSVSGRPYIVPWVTIKQIMADILGRAALAQSREG